MNMESPAFSVKKQACIPLHLIFWVFNSWTWSLHCCSPPTIAQKSSQVSQKGFQNKHGLLDSRVRQQSHGTLSVLTQSWALPGHFPVPKLLQPSANFSWTLSNVRLETTGCSQWTDDAQTTHCHLSLPSAPSLLPKQENPADKDHQCYIFIHGQKSHPYCTPIAITIIKEAFGSWTLLNWRKAVMDRS